MQMKDATSRIGSVGLLIPLILIILTAADSAFACPGHKTGVAYRTGAINNKTVSRMPATVISYRAPASYKRCGDNMFDTRGRRYVAVRSHGNTARYIAVRNGDAYYKVRPTRYVAVRNADIADDAPRYVAVRHRDPVYRISDTKYAEIRSGYRSGNGVVRYIDVDDDDEPRYVAVRTVAPRTRYVAVRNIDIDDDDEPRYVAVRNVNTGCTRAVALRRCLGQIETTSARQVVLRNDDVYSTKYVALRDESDDDEDIVLPGQTVSRTRYVALNDVNDDADIAVPIATVSRANYVEYADAAYYDGNGVTVGDVPEAVSTRTISYVPVTDDDDIDDQAFLDGGGATYVAAGDIEDACLSPASTRAVSYVPVEDVDDDAFQTGSSTTYIVTNDAAQSIRNVPVVDDDDEDTIDIATDDVDDTCLRPVALRACDDDAGAGTVSLIPVDDVEDIDAETVSYVPVVKDMGASTVSYIPVDDMNVETVSRVPVKTVDAVNATYVAADECPEMVSSIDREPVYVANNSAILVADGDSDLVAELSSTQQIAGQFGYRDGFKDGQDAALERDAYHPENSGDYQKATEGYEDTFGDKDVYKDAYRSSYLRGYRAGFDSAASTA